MTRAKFEILSTGEVTRIHDASLDVLASHQPPALPAEVEKKIWNIVREAEKRQA